MLQIIDAILSNPNDYTQVYCLEFLITSTYSTSQTPVLGRMGCSELLVQQVWADDPPFCVLNHIPTIGGWQLSLLYANLSPENILLKDNLDALAHAHPNFKVFWHFIVLSC